MIEKKLSDIIRNVPDFPKPGIQFKDITPVLHDAALCREIVDVFSDKIKVNMPDAIIGIESRGFLFGFSIAQKLDLPFIMVRKAGKLPYHKHSYEYSLEYGKSVIEMHADALKPGWKVLIHDDLLATGGTAAAAAELVKMQGASVSGFAFMVELPFLNGREILKSHASDITSLISY